MSLFQKALLVLVVLVASAANTRLAAEESGLRVIEKHIIDLNAMKDRRIVRVLVPFSKTIYFVDKGRQFGTAFESGLALEEHLNKEVDPRNGRYVLECG